MNDKKLDKIIDIMLFERKLERLGTLKVECDGDDITLVARDSLMEDRKKLAIMYDELEKMKP